MIEGRSNPRDWPQPCRLLEISPLLSAFKSNTRAPILKAQAKNEDPYRSRFPILKAQARNEGPYLSMFSFLKAQASNEGLYLSRFSILKAQGRNEGPYSSGSPSSRLKPATCAVWQLPFRAARQRNDQGRRARAFLPVDLPPPSPFPNPKALIVPQPTEQAQAPLPRAFTVLPTDSRRRGGRGGDRIADLVK